MRLLLITGLVFISHWVSAQKVLNIKYPAEVKAIELTKSTIIPTITAGYTLWLPSKTSPKGLVVVQEPRRDTVIQNVLVKSALRNQLAVVYITTNNPIEFFFTEKSIKKVADDIVRICSNFNIPKNEILYIGKGLSGTRALKLAIYCEQNKDYNSIKPKAIALSDAPIDIHRYFNSAKEMQTISFNEDQDEVTFSVREYIEENLNGTPLTSKARYASYSPYSKYVRNGGNAGYFTKTYIRGYVSEDVNYYNEILGGNAFDVYNFIEQLKRLGSERAEIILTQPGKSRSNSTFDEKEVVSWFTNIASF